MQTIKQEIRQEIGRLVLFEPFFATIALGMELVVRDDESTAWTNGKEMGFGVAFWQGLSRKQRRTLIAHECLHVANLHDLREGMRNHAMWNEACDWAINPHLIGPEYDFPPGGCVDAGKLAEYRGKSAEEIYSLLPGNQIPPAQPESPQPGEGDEKEQGEGQGEGQGEPQPWGEVRPTPASNLDAPEDEDETIAQRKQLVQQAINAAKAHGEVPCGMERTFEDMLAPVVNWRDLLSRFVEGHSNSDWSMMRPTSKYGEVLMPTLHSDAFARVAVAVDTSGSMCAASVTSAITELHEALNVYREEGQDTPIEVAYADTRVHEKFTLEDPSDLQLPRGGGGTDFEAALHVFEQDAEPPVAMIYLTDGYCSTSNCTRPPYDVLWVITTGGNNEFDPAFGEVLRMG